jgi:superkiller protein 3
MRKKLPVLFFAMVCAAATALVGCADANRKTQKEEATEQWNAARAAVLHGLARDQFQNGNFDKARETVTQAMRLDPKNAKLHQLSAKLAIEQGQLELAERELTTARELDPKDAEADYLSGVVCQRWQKPAAAYDCYSSAVDKAPNELAYVLAKAEMLVAMDRSKDALALLQEKVSTFDHSPVIRDAIGQLLVQQGRHADAVEMLRQACALATEDNSIREHLAMAMCMNKQYREAAEMLARLLKDPKNAQRADLYLAYGECQLQCNRLPEARGSFESAAGITPTSQQAWTGLAKAALAAGDLRRADLALRRATALDANNAQTTLLVGYLRVRENKLPQALAAFQKASELDRNDTVSVCMIGYVMEKQGHPAKAMQYYSRALKMKPADELATRLMATVDMNE